MGFSEKSAQHVSDLFITGNVLYGTSDDSTASNATSPSLLVDGSIGIYFPRGNAESGGALADGAILAHNETAGDIEGINEFYFAVNMGGNIITSQIFDRRAFSWRYRDAAAQAVQKTIVEATYSSSPADADEYSLVIIATTSGNEPSSRKQFSVMGSEVSSTATLVTALAAAITAYINSEYADDSFPLASAVNTSNELVLTGKRGETFEIALQAELEGNTVVMTGTSTAGTAATSMTPGSGYKSQILQLEKDIQVTRGYLNNVVDYGRRPASNVDTALADPAYDLITISGVKNQLSAGAVAGSTEGLYRHLYIAHPASATTGSAGEIQDALKALFDLLDQS